RQQCLNDGAVDASISGVAGSLNSLARTIGMTIGISFGATYFLPSCQASREFRRSRGHHSCMHWPLFSG
ncbi:efflux pump antibiotic resistance protein, partial [Lacticaseibacillus paracasei subsp. paracasei Lpp14]